MSLSKELKDEFAHPTIWQEHLTPDEILNTPVGIAFDYMAAEGSSADVAFAPVKDFIENFVAIYSDGDTESRVEACWELACQLDKVAQTFISNYDHAREVTIARIQNWLTAFDRLTIYKLQLGPAGATEVEELINSLRSYWSYGLMEKRRAAGVGRVAIAA